MTSLRKLQEAVKDQKEPQNPSLLPIITRIRKSEDKLVITDDLFVTAKIGMRNGVLNPNEILVDSIIGAYEVGPDVIQLAGIALRYGADPNLYIRTIDTNGDRTNIHVLYYVWVLTPKDTEDVRELNPDLGQIEAATSVLDEYHRIMEDIMGLLVLAGSDINSPVVDLETEIGQPGNAQVPTILRAGDRLKSVKFNIERDGSRKDVGSNDLTTPASRALTSVDTYENVRERLGDTVAIDDLSRDAVVFFDDASALNDEAPETIACITGHAIKCFEKSLNIRLVTFAESEMFLEEAIDSYNVPAVITLLERGAQPKYNIIDRTILAAGKAATVRNRPLSAALLDRMMIEMALRGVGFDNPQLKLIETYSPSTAKALRDIQTTPYWKRTCRAAGNNVRGDLKVLARELGIPPGAPKNEICLELQNIDRASESQLESIALKLQRRRLEARKTRLGDLVTGRTQKATKTEGTSSLSENQICVNEKFLPNDSNGNARKASDFSDLDIIFTRSQGNNYCFTSEDYVSLLQSQRNPLTEESLPGQTINEIKAKLTTLESNKLSLRSMGITETIKTIKTEKSNDLYDAFTRQRVNDFLTLAANDYGIFSQVFTEELTNLEMETIATEITGIFGTTFDITSRERSLRSFGNTMMELVDRAETQEDIDIIFYNISDLLSEVFGEPGLPPAQGPPDQGPE